MSAVGTAEDKEKTMQDMERQKMLERINSLIAKAESTEHPEEAKVFMEKAQELLAKYSLSEYDLQGASTLGEKDKVVTVSVMVTDPWMQSKSNLLSGIARANNVKVVYGYKRRRASKSDIPTDYITNEKPIVIVSDNRSIHFRLLYLTGFSKDVDATVLLYTSFLIQMFSEISRTEIPRYEPKGTWTNHFIIGFSNTVLPRLRRANDIARQNVVDEAKARGSNLLPVLVSRKEQVEAVYEQVWGGKLGTARGSYATGSTSGLGHGRAAGSRADIGSKRVGGLGALGTGK